MKNKIFVLAILSFVGLTSISCGKSEEHNYISSSEEFLSALKRGDKTIYIDSFAFDKETNVNLSYAVNIIGRNAETTIKNANFELDGTLIVTESTSYSFSNVIFDGGVDESKYDFATPGQTFYSMFGSNRSNKKCFNVLSGYTNLSLTNCEIMHYASYEAPAINIDNKEEYCLSERYLSLDNVKVHHNICYEGTLKVSHDKGVTSIKNCSFYENIAKNAGGLAVANGKGLIDNSKVINNRHYRFVNNNADGNPMFPDDKLNIGGVEYNYVSFSGSLYVGGANMSVTNSLISGNKNLFGGGIGFCNPQSSIEGQKIVFKNNIIINNEASYGGAIFAKSKAGNTTKFINCVIQNNKAKYGGIIYATTLAPYVKSFYGGIIDFIFSSLTLNVTSDEVNNFSFKELCSPEVAGNIELHGSFVVDDATYEDHSTNYVENINSSLTNNVISNDDINNANEQIIYPRSGSKGDISINVDTYKSWDECFANSKQERKIGFIEVSTPSNLRLILAILIPCLFLLVVTLVIVSIIHTRRRHEIETRNIDAKLSTYTYESLLPVVTSSLNSFNLTNKEFEVATYLLLCKSRKELANKLYVSEDTVKTHISHIFKKLKISSKQDLKKIINKYL